MEELWGAPLSEDAELIWQAVGRLSAEEAEAVLAHLRKMAAEEESYSETQRQVAQIALEAIRGNK